MAAVILPAPSICDRPAPASVGALFLAEDAIQKDQSWLSGLVPAGPPTVTDWGFLTLGAVGLVALAVLLVTYFMI
jgi:hypothetical protein